MKQSGREIGNGTWYDSGRLFRRSRLTIRARLTACFVAIVLSMIAADGVVVWQLRRVTGPTQRLSAADSASLAIVRLHLDVDAFRDTANALVISHDNRRAATELTSLRHTFLQHVEVAEQALRAAPVVEGDSTIATGLETLKLALPSQIDTTMALANAGDWNALRPRLARQSEDPVQLSSLLVEKLNQEVLQERAGAIESTQKARRELLIAVPIAGLLTLLAAAILGWYVTRSITVPLFELAAAAQALARGDFQHQVDERGSDELSVLGRAFNYAARGLKELYDGLQRSERELRNVIETIPAMAFTVLPDGFRSFVNRRWVEYTGLTVEQALGSGWQVVIHPDDRDRLLEKWQKTLATGDSLETEARYRGVDGEYRWFLLRSVPLRDAQGQILHWYGILTDIDDRKRAEALLAGEKRILEMVAKGDPLSQILNTLCRLVEEHATGVLASILLVDGDRLRHGGAPSLPKAYTEAIDGAAIGPSAGSCGTAAYRGEQVIVEDIATNPLWAQYRDLALPYSLRACWSTPIFSSEGTVIATFAMYYGEPRTPGLRDQEIIKHITHLAGVAIERKLTHEALRRSEAYLAEAQKLSHTGSWAWNVRTGDVFWSQEMFHIYDYDPKTKPSWSHFIERVHPEDRPSVEKRAKLESTQTFSLASEGNYRIVLRDGTIRHLRSICHPVIDESGQVTETVGTVIDVTERQQSEQERERLRQLEADLAHINRITTMGELTASLAHEINQPIAAAATDASTCLRWLAPDRANLAEARDAAKRVVKDANRAADIIRRVRLLFQKSPSEREFVDVNEVIQELILLLRHEPNHQAISIHSDLTGNLPKVVGDRVQLQQVLMNLMLNGIEAMRHAGAIHELMITSRAENGHLLVSVSDTGLGIPPGQMDQIFDAFFTTKPNGIGMGLAISRSIVESHGGRLWAVGNPKSGTTFHFTLPVGASVPA